LRRTGEARVLANSTPTVVPSAAAAERQPSNGLRRVVVGTAGHVDHGKTALIKALTGIDCDRWAEEKARGITIDLGFAHLTEGDLQVGFVDVPGHHRFLHNALAGLGGIRVMLLVVAADEGVMPQTREHLAICSLLGIPAGLAALTKRDQAPADVLELAELETRELLEASPFAGSPIVPVSSVTGEGLPELRSRLLELAGRHEVHADEGAPIRLPIDRAFHLRGLGVVVTGTLASGIVRTGDALEIAPGGPEVRVRSIQVHGTARDQAAAGERTSLQLAGAELADLERGRQLVSPGSFASARALCARFTLLPDAPQPLDRPLSVRVHLYSSAAPAQLRPLDPPCLEPGESGLVELRLAAPVVAVRGDRLIVRRLSPATTLGGGEVLDPLWTRRRGSALGAALTALTGGDDEAILYWVASGNERGAEGEALAQRLGVRPDRILARLQPLQRAGRLATVADAQGRDRWWLVPEVYERVARRASQVLDAYFERDRLAPGLPRAEAVRRILPAVPAALVQHFLGDLEKRGIATVEAELVVRPGRSVRLAPAEQAAADRLLALLEAAGATPPPEEALRAECGTTAKAFDSAARYLLDRRKLLRLPGGMLIAASAVDALREGLLATGWAQFTVPEFKDRFGLTRKWAIPLLELFDSTGLTRRIGDQRLVSRTP
jgi:selenocysteine-specific elongation factor